MTIAVSSYTKVSTLEDKADVLNLAWSLDEREFLDISWHALLETELRAELEEGLAFLNTYLVQDPYGTQQLKPAISALHHLPIDSFDVLTGSGVNTILFALSRLTVNRPAYIIGNVYPDFPHWVREIGSTCLSRHAPDMGESHPDNIRACSAGVVLLERPALVTRTMDLGELESLCRSLQHHDVLVVVDESYANYHAPAYSAASLVGDLKNLIVIRGLSKAYSLGSLRLGYCVASPVSANRIRDILPPMSVSSLSFRIGKKILEQGDATKELQQRIRMVRQLVSDHVLALGLPAALPFFGNAPFLFWEQAEAIRDALEARGILGKEQPFWSETERQGTHYYKMALPLNEDRLNVFQRRCL